MSMARRVAYLGMVAVAGWVASACGEGEERSLPAEYLGAWYSHGTSGGMDGEVVDEGGGRIEITADNEIHHFDANGAPVGTTSFELSRGHSIYTGNDAWLLDASAGIPRVIDLLQDGALSIADNVYDGYGTVYRRTPPER